MFLVKLRLHGQDVTEVALESGREYTFGRSSECSVQLQEQPGISRTHFKVSEVDGAWEVQVLSKFGDLTYAGSPIQNMKLENGTVFKLAGYDFLFFERAMSVAQSGTQPQTNAEAEGYEMPMASGQSSVMAQPPSTQSSANLPARLAPVDFEGSDESTKIIESTVAAGLPFIRIVDGSGREETTKLEGRKWLAGREEGSQILLNDRKASRKQFELSTSPQGNFIRDLGSSNGTLLNGMPLAADELKAIRSGDVIQVGQLSIHFEVRDPNFERRLMVVPQEVLSSVPAVSQPSGYEMINFPVPTGPGGAVRVDGSGGAPAIYEGHEGDYEREAKEAKNKKIRFYAIAALVIAGVVYFLTDEPPKPKPKPAAVANDPLSKLTPQQQQKVKELMVLGRNLFMQGKQALAAEQLKKLHEILPTGYENSLAIAQECEEQARIEEQRRAVERELQIAAENRVIVDENLRKCEPLANSTMEEGELRACLAPTYERDPTNVRVEEFLNRVRARIAERDAKLEKQKDYASAVAAGKRLFANAERLEKQGDLDSAVEAYGKHVASRFPDPENLKATSRSKISSMKANKAAAISRYLQAAQLAFTNQKYPEAVNNINKIKALDPQNEEAAELNANIQKQKNQKLRTLYEESIISEGLGQIDEAKKKWKEILETDHPDGQYYKRAKNKMKAFGGS